MKRAFILLIVFMLLLSGCSPSRTVKDEAIKDFNKELKQSFEEIKKIKTYIIRPSLNWDIYVSDTENMDDIFYYVVDYLKTSNIVEDELRDKYTGVYFISRITITVTKKKTRRTYQGYYYKRGTTIYADNESANVVDNFTTWYRWDDDTWIYNYGETE